MAEQFVFTFNGAYLKGVVNAYRQLVDTFVFHFTRENIRACVMATDRYRLIEIVITPYDYRAYVDEVWVQGDMGVLWGAVKKLKKAETVTVKVEDDKFYVGALQPGEVVPFDWIEPDQKFDLEFPAYFELVVPGSLHVFVAGFKKILRSAPPDTLLLGFDIDEPGGHIILGGSILDLGVPPLEWLLEVSGKAREAYTLDLFTSLLVPGLIEHARIHITEKGLAIVEYAEDQCTVKLYIAPFAGGKETITEILARPKPVRTEILRMWVRVDSLYKAVKAIGSVNVTEEVTVDPTDGLGIFWEVGYLKVPSRYLETWTPPTEPTAGVFNLEGLVKFLKDVEDLGLFLVEVEPGEMRLLLRGKGPKIAPKALLALEPGAVGAPEVEGAVIFTGPADLLKRTMEDAKVTAEEYLVFYTTPYEIEAFGRNATYYEATFELNDFQAVEEGYIPLGNDSFDSLIGFFRNVPADWCSVGKTEKNHTYLSCATDIGELRAVLPQWYLEGAIKAYEERVKRPVAPPEAEKLPEAPPKPEYLNIPYGIESLVGARVSYLEAILPDWELVGTLGPLTRPDGRVSMHAHFTEISEDMAAHREPIMEALKKIHEVFRALGVEQIMSSAALEPFKDRTASYAFILQRAPPKKATFEDVMLWYEKMTEPVERTALERVLVTAHFGYVSISDTIDKMMRAGKFIEHPLRGAGFLDVPKPPPEVPPTKLLDPAKAEVAEIRSLTRGPFRFVILNDGAIRVVSMGKFLTKEELEARPELLEEAQGYFLEELETLGIKPPAFELVTVYPLTHLNEFPGVDKKRYGPFEAGETALIPRENAEQFVKERFASWTKPPPKPEIAPPPEVAPPPAKRTYAELEKEFEEKDPWDALAIFVSRFEGFKRDYSMEDLHRFLREFRERTSPESIHRFYKIYPQLKDDFVSIAGRIGWTPPAPPLPEPPPRRPPPTRLKPEEVEEVWEQFFAFARVAEIVEPLVYRDRFIETIRTSPTVANAVERARRLISRIQRDLRPPPAVLPAPPTVPVPDVAEVYRRLGVPPGAPVSETAFQTIWRTIQRELAVEPPRGLIRSELDYLWREFADFLRKFDMDPERHRPEFEEVINPDFNLVENLDSVMKKVHELTDSDRWGPERWR